jgi:hypothetical protein
MLNFCTLFNSGYLSRGLVLYESLIKSCPNSHLYVFAFDDVCYNYLKKKSYTNMTVISLQEFEDEKLLGVKSTRSSAEYCWTCTASIIRYAILTFHLPQCTYLDADMYFYSNPQILIDEMGSNSVLITEHRYTKEYDQSEISGKYCVQFMTFNNDSNGMKVLEWWRDACIDWCFARAEDGKFGDQKYLDTWIKDFKGVHVLNYLGGGVAPWNAQQYVFFDDGKGIKGKELSSGKKFDLVFFHFHGLKLYHNHVASLTSETYEFESDFINLIYKPYLNEIKNKGIYLAEELPNVNFHAAASESEKKPLNFISLVRWYFYDIRKDIRNILGTQTLKRKKHYHFIKF